MSSSHNEVKESSQLDSEIQIQMPQLTITNMTKQKRCKAQSLLPGQAKFVSMMPLLFLSGITCFMDTQATNMALPYMQKDFKISESLVQWSLTIYYLAQASLSIPLAKLGENIGQVYILLILFVLSTGLNIALFFVKNFPAFLVLRFLSGAVCGGQLVCRTSLVRKLAPPEKAQAYIQYLQILLSIMVIIVPLLAGILIDIQWRWVYIACAASAFLNIFTLIPYTNPETPKEKAKFDIWGCIVLFFAIGFLDLAFTILSTYHYLGCGILVVLSRHAFCKKIAERSSFGYFLRDIHFCGEACFRSCSSAIVDEESGGVLFGCQYLFILHWNWFWLSFTLNIYVLRPSGQLNWCNYHGCCDWDANHQFIFAQALEAFFEQAYNGGQLQRERFHARLCDYFLQQRVRLHRHHVNLSNSLYFLQLAYFSNHVVISPATVYQLDERGAHHSAHAGPGRYNVRGLHDHAGELRLDENGRGRQTGLGERNESQYDRFPLVLIRWVNTFSVQNGLCEE
ncbi:Major_facilitator superfamily protein [Hexamita inflata]|uniref:Major_facilitator superfamily protein n=1 Tax=Hexamita inflata TaxID=28002 RepID=A0ABP1KB72_9EUKA